MRASLSRIQKSVWSNLRWPSKPSHRSQPSMSPTLSAVAAPSASAMDDPVVAVPRAEEDAESGDSGLSESEGDDGLDYEIDINEGELDYAAAGYEFKERVMHFLRGERISMRNRSLVENAVLIAAGSYVTDLGKMAASDLHAKMLTRYFQIIREFDTDDFDHEEVRSAMLTKRYQAQNNICGEALWKSFGEVRSELRTLASKFPNDLAKLPSGHQLHDLFRAYILERYKALHVSLAHFALPFYLRSELTDA